MGTVIQMVATSTGGTESALASMDVPANGAIVGVEWAGRTAFDTTADFQLFQLSFGTAFNNSNDSRQVISNISTGTYTEDAAGTVVGKANGYTPLPLIPVGMGERLFLHSIASAATVGQTHCNIHFDFDLDKVQVRRR